MARGLLIALEGIDGSGKTTQLTMLADHVRARGRVVHTTAEPSEGPVGGLLRRALRGEPLLDEATLALLFAADRLDHVGRELASRLDAGEVVLTDRYLLSSMVYQSTYLPLDWIAEINRRARRPDCSVILSIDPEVAAQRRAQRGTAEEHFEGLQRQRRLAEAYRLVASRPDVGPCLRVDAERGVESVAADLRGMIDPLLAASP